MNDIPTDLGQTLAELRNAVGLKQLDIAQSLNLDQSRISRVEKGDVTPSAAEIDGYLSAIGTDDAEDYRKFLKQHWEILERPLYRHPQRDALCKAETCLQKLKEFTDQKKLTKSTKGQAQMYRDSLLREATYLSSLKHSIAYIGDIGVGKTTVVCLQTGLISSNAERSNLKNIVLETGAGGTTVCEVRIRSGSHFEIRVEPQEEIEIYSLVEEFCTNLTNGAGRDQQNQEKGVSSEIKRALRNMAGLAREKRQGADGQKRFDPLKELIAQFDNQADLSTEFSRRLLLPQRTKREIKFEETSKQTAIDWLKETFADINNGRHKDFSLPKWIDIIVPQQSNGIPNVLESKNYELEIIDTKGVDGTALRPDLEKYLKDERTLTVLCSSFNSAPDPSIQRLIEHLIEAKKSEKTLEKRGILLVFPRNDEAVQEKYEDGEAVKTDEEGYELKQEKVEEKLESIGISSIPIHFFNATSDDMTTLIAALNERIEYLRHSHTERLSEVVAAINTLIENREKRETKKAQREFTKRLRIFLEQNRKLSSSQLRVDHYLVGEVRNAHARTVWATTRRKGFWSNLNVYFLLGSGARAVAWRRSQQAFIGLTALINNQLGDPDQQPIYSFLNELSANWDKWRENFLESAQRSGEQTFRPRLSDSSIWAESESEYGDGIQFRRWFIYRVQNWFDAPEQQDLHNLLKIRIEDAWQKEVLDQLENLLDEGTKNGKNSVKSGINGD